MAREMHASALSPSKLSVPAMRYHVGEHIVTMDNQRLLSLVRFKGISHKFLSDSELNDLVEVEDRYFIAAGKREGKNLMLQTFITKSKIELAAEYELPQPVLQGFVDEYIRPFKNGAFRQTGYAMAIILKYTDLDDGIKRMRQLIDMTNSMLSKFQPTFMGLEESKRGAVYSQVGRYFSMLLNGHERDVLCNDVVLSDALIDSVTDFGKLDYIETLPNRGGARYGTTYDLQGFPRPSRKGMWDEAIEQPYDFTLVQSFLFHDRNKAKTMFRKQGADLASVEGESTQTDELDAAVQQITQGDLAFANYHASLIVYGDTPQAAIENGSKMESMFEVQNTTFKRSTITNIFTVYTQFPGFSKPMYPLVKATGNLACGFSLHNVPVGKAKGNPIGDGTGLVPMQTDNQGLFILNAHNSPPGQNNLGEKLPGHIAVTGQTGAGKTTLEGLMLTFLSRWNNMLFGLDYNHSLENLFRVLGAHYYTITPGQFTGINPFQLPDSEALRQFLFDTVVTCAGKTTDAEKKQIHKAIGAVMAHSTVANRGMSLLLQDITLEGGDCLHTRLSKWCRLNHDGPEGQNAWVLDSPLNQFDPSQFRRLVFDCTKVLQKSYVSKHPEVMEVLLNTMFFVKQLMHQAEPGALLVNFIAEYWVPLSFESTAERIKEILKSGRTRGEILMMDTQSPEDAIATPYAPAVIQQVITTIWLANERASAEGYAKFGITGKLFDELKAIEPLSREMLVVQGKQAVKVKLDLAAKNPDGSPGKLKYWLPLLSSDDRNLAVAAEVRRTLNSDDPAVWAPVFLDKWAELQRGEDD